MTLEAIEVECYSGGRADERPRKVTIGGKTYRVARLLGESVEESIESKGWIHRYRLLTDDGVVLEVARDDAGWRLTRIPVPPG